MPPRGGRAEKGSVNLPRARMQWSASLASERSRRFLLPF
jgi:hypothetical protein